MISAWQWLPPRMLRMPPVTLSQMRSPLENLAYTNLSTQLLLPFLNTKAIATIVLDKHKQLTPSLPIQAMSGVGDVIGCVSLSIQALSGLPRIYAFLNAFKSSSDQAQKVADECGDLHALISRIEALVTRIRSLPGPITITSMILLRAAIISCQSTINAT